MTEKENSSTGKEKIGGGVFNCRYDEHFTLIDADDYLFAFLGYTREEFAERFHNHVLDAVYEGDREMIREEISRQLKTGNVFMYENRLVKKGGTICWVWISAEFKEDKKDGNWFHCIFHDTSAEKEAQRQLAISEQRYEIVLSQMQILFSSWTVLLMRYIILLILRRNSVIRFPRRGFRILCSPQTSYMRQIKRD